MNPIWLVHRKREAGVARQMVSKASLEAAAELYEFTKGLFEILSALKGLNGLLIGAMATY
jgi:hypothetical protein